MSSFANSFQAWGDMKMSHVIADNLEDDEVSFHRKVLTKALKNVNWDTVSIEAIIDILLIVSREYKEYENVSGLNPTGGEYIARPEGESQETSAHARN
jgi:hypothetical protein